MNSTSRYRAAQALAVHTCHLPGCTTPCPPRHLFCGRHWGMVPRKLQSEVYAGVRQRNPDAVDHTWAPWYRAQAKASAAVLRTVAERLGELGPETEERIGRRLAHELAVANRMEATKGTTS